jgi:glycosyltransferase involved in cell wall biosynthesis
MWEQNKISVVFPVFNEEEGVKACIEEYFSIGIVDEIIAVDNNSTDNSANEIKKTNAKYVK